MAQLFAKLAVAFGTQADKKDGEPLLEAARVHSNESTQFPFGKAWLGMVGHRTAPGRARMNAKSGIMKAGHWPGLDILKCIRDQNPTSVSPIFSQVLILIRKYLLHIMMCAFVHRLHCFVVIRILHICPLGPLFSSEWVPASKDVQSPEHITRSNVIQPDPTLHGQVAPWQPSQLQRAVRGSGPQIKGLQQDPGEERKKQNNSGKETEETERNRKKQEIFMQFHAWTIMDLLGQYVTRIFARSSHRAFTRSCKDFLRDFTADLFS